MTTAATNPSPARYRDFFRFKHIDWAWLRAHELLQQHRQPVQGFDTNWIRRALRYLQRRSGQRRAASRGLPEEDFTDIAIAHKVQQDAGLFRDILQAMLLTTLPFSEIAAKTGLTAAGVAAYEQLFFDVRTRLPHRGWIMTQAVGRPSLLCEGRTIGQVLRRLAYFAGDYVLDSLVAYLQKHQPTAFRAPISKVELSERDERAIRRCLALEMLTLDNRSVVLLFRQHVEMLRQQQRDRQTEVPEATEQDWLEHVQFTGDGSNLAAELDPVWVAARTAVA